MKVMDNVKRTTMNKLIDYIVENPEENIQKAVNMLDTFLPDSLFAAQRSGITQAVEDKNNWYQLILRAAELNPEVAPDFLKALLTEANIIAWDEQEKNREKYGCNIPWAMILDPTSACNLACIGCWAADYGNALNLSYEELDDIVNQGTALGTHFYIFSGGEPLVRKRDIIRLCEAHKDCIFTAFTNGTLIDEEFCQEMIRVKNFAPIISVEGDEASTDARRGNGTFAKVVAAMDLLRSHGLPFGASLCITSANADTITQESYYQWLVDKGALFAWIFTYMPVGNDASPELLLRPDQRKRFVEFNRAMRDKLPFFTLDFQNDGEFVGGCIAGGRRFLHINANGDVEPCAFIHYADSNIHENTLLESLQRPLFMQYYENQPFNDNLLRPCPMLENPESLVDMVETSGAHSTDMASPEDVHHLCAKCEQRAQEWAPVAEAMWTDEEDARAKWRARRYQGMSNADIHKFERQDRTLHGAFDDDRILESITQQNNTQKK